MFNNTLLSTSGRPPPPPTQTLCATKSSNRPLAAKHRNVAVSFFVWASYST